MNDGVQFILMGIGMIFAGRLYYKSWKKKGLDIHLKSAFFSYVWGILFIVIGLHRLLSMRKP